MPPHIEAASLNNEPVSGLQTVQMSVGCPHCTKDVRLSVIVHHPDDKDSKPKVTAFEGEKRDASDDESSGTEIEDNANAVPSEVGSAQSDQQIPHDKRPRKRKKKKQRTQPQQQNNESEINQDFFSNQNDMVLEEVQLASLTQAAGDNQPSEQESIDQIQHFETQESVKQEDDDDDDDDGCIVIKEEPGEESSYDSGYNQTDVFQGDVFSGMQANPMGSLLKHAEPEPMYQGGQRGQFPQKRAFPGFAHRGRRMPWSRGNMRRRPIPASTAVRDMQPFRQTMPTQHLQMPRNPELISNPQIPTSQYAPTPNFSSEMDDSNYSNEPPPEEAQFTDSQQEMGFQGAVESQAHPGGAAAGSDGQLTAGDSWINNGVAKSCRYCGKQWPSVSSLRTHEKTVHLGIKAFNCRFCPKKYSRKDDFDIHEFMHHRSEADELGIDLKANIFECDFCNKIFRRKRHLIVHLKNSHNITINVIPTL